MTLKVKPAKFQVVKTLDGKLHFAVGAGPVHKPVKPKVKSGK